mgnify:CR=1 FL=1
MKWKAIANSYVKDIKVKGKPMILYGESEFKFLPKNFDNVDIKPRQRTDDVVVSWR